MATQKRISQIIREAVVRSAAQEGGPWTAERICREVRSAMLAERIDMGLVWLNDVAILSAFSRESQGFLAGEWGDSDA